MQEWNHGLDASSNSHPCSMFYLKNFSTPQAITYAYMYVYIYVTYIICIYIILYNMIQVWYTLCLKLWVRWCHSIDFFQAETGPKHRSSFRLDILPWNGTCHGNFMAQISTACSKGTGTNMESCGGCWAYNGGAPESSMFDIVWRIWQNHTESVSTANLRIPPCLFSANTCSNHVPTRKSYPLCSPPVRGTETQWLKSESNGCCENMALICVSINMKS